MKIATSSEYACFHTARSVINISQDTFISKRFRETQRSAWYVEHGQEADPLSQICTKLLFQRHEKYVSLK